MAIGDMLEAQGHKLTGRLIRSLAPKLDAGEKLSGAVLWERYGEAINNGVPRSRIPYSPGSGAGSSEYIRGLLNFVRRARLRPRGRQTQLGIAFAIANSHKKYGMPLVGSKRFSKTGRRTGAVEEALEKEKKATQQYMEEVALAVIDEAFFEAFAHIATSQYITIVYN